MARKQSPSRQRYAEGHPTIGVHVDLPTYGRLSALRDKSGLSFGYLVRRSLGVVEKEVDKLLTRGWNKGHHAGYEEGFQDGYRNAFQEGQTEGRRLGLAEAERRYKLEYRCVRCRRPMSICAGAADATAAVEFLETRWGHGYGECPTE